MKHIRLTPSFVRPYLKPVLKSYVSLTLNLQGSSYLGLTRSISWLLTPWLLVLPGHQQSWYWPCKIDKPWSYTRSISINYGISVWRNDIRCKYLFMFPLNQWNYEHNYSNWDRKLQTICLINSQFLILKAVDSKKDPLSILITSILIKW